MNASLIIESNGKGARLSAEADGTPLPWGEAANVAAAGALAGARSVEERDSIGNIELRVREADAQAHLARVGAVLVGIPHRAAQRLDLAAKVVSGGTIDVHGSEQIPVDESHLREMVSQAIREHAPDIYVVSGMNSHRNPQHEQRAAAVVRELSGRPVLEARYWSDALNAIERAMVSALGAATTLILQELRGVAEETRRSLGREMPIRATALDDALVTALLNCPPLNELAELLGGGITAGVTQKARVSRGENGYTCHCTDGLFEFDSVVRAKAFAAEHLRSKMDEQSRRLGLEPGQVQLSSEDRYTFVRGRRGPVRVYLETLIVAHRET